MEEPHLDPKVFFNMMFGGGKFEEYIGELGLSSVLGGQEGEDDQPPNEEQKAKERAERVKTLSKLLAERLVLYTPQTKETFMGKFKEEAGMLKDESFGLELLHSIGYIYEKKAKHFISQKQTLGWIPNFFRDIGVKAHTIRSALGAVTATIDVVRVATRTQVWFICLII